MGDEPRVLLPRRRFLGALAVGPAAIAACATAAAPAARPEAEAAREATVATPAAPPPGREASGLAAVRAYPLSPAAQPALVFRAIPGRLGCEEP